MIRVPASASLLDVDVVSRAQPYRTYVKTLVFREHACGSWLARSGSIGAVGDQRNAHREALERSPVSPSRCNADELISVQHVCAGPLQKWASERETKGVCESAKRYLLIATRTKSDSHACSMCAWERVRSLEQEQGFVELPSQLILGTRGL